MKWLLSKISKNQTLREKRQETPAVDPQYSNVIPHQLLFLFIAVCYSTLAPIVTGLAALHFYTFWRIMEHLLVTGVVASDFDGGGGLMFLVNKFLFLFIFSGEILMIVYLGIQKQPVCAGLSVLVVIGTIILKKRIDSFCELATRASVLTCQQIDERDVEEDGELKGIALDETPSWTQKSLQRGNWMELELQDSDVSL